METKELQKLKINASKINSLLIRNNKQFRKLRLNESSFIKNQQEQEKKSLKEQTLEKSSTFKKALSSIKDKIMSGPMSIFDKIKEFFGIIFVGFLVNALPGIIGRLKKFFQDNPQIISAVKELFKFLGDITMEFIKIVNSLTPNQQEKLNTERKQVDEGINNLDNELNIIDKLMNGLFSVFNATSSPQVPTVNNPNYSSFIAGGGKAAVKKGRSVSQVIQQGQQNISRYNSGPRVPRTGQPQPINRFNNPYQPQPGVPIQAFAEGGTVQPTSQKTKQDVGTASEATKSKVTSGTFSRGSAKGKKARQSVNSFRFFKTNTQIAEANLAQQNENNNLFERLSKNLKSFTRLVSGRKGEKETPPGDGDGNGLPPGGEPVVTGGTSDFWLLSLISLYENTNPQGAADVAQSIYNRMANSGQSAKQVILAENQYQPVRKFGGYSEWGKVIDRETAIAHIKKYPGNGASVKGLDIVAQALLDSSKQSEAAKFVGILPDFRNQGYEQRNDEMTDDKSRHNHTFGFNRGGSRGKITKPAQVPSFVEADVLTQYTPTELIGTNTAFQGKTGRVTGEHFHIGPSQLLNLKTLQAENNGTPQGLIDARQAAFRVAKALIARRQAFTFTNAGIAINPNERITDQQLRNYILSEQNAHMSRSMGSSWGGVDIYAHKSGMDVPIPVGQVVFHGDGFGYRALLQGTKGFVAHLTPGSKATPLDKIKKSESPSKPIIKQTDLDRLKTVINSSPGSGQEVRIPGVGTYVRGKDGLFAVDKYFDENGRRITVNEFYDRLEKVKKESNLISATSNTSIDVAKIERGNLDMKNSSDSNTIIAYAVQPVVSTKTTTRYVKGPKEYVYLESDSSQDISNWELV